MSASGLFICGTDTGIGKTYCSALLIRAFAQRGLRVAGMKPVASGAQMVNGKLINEDALQLVTAMNITCDYELVNPYCFVPAIAPHIAAQESGTYIAIDRIAQAYHQLAQRAEVVIVEGVGGWSVPINDSQTMVDVVSQLQLPVIMVVGIKLGCLNHALLTAEAIAHSGNRLSGWIANILDPHMSRLDANIDTLKQRLPAPHLANVPFAADTLELDETCWQQLHLCG